LLTRYHSDRLISTSGALAKAKQTLSQATEASAEKVGVEKDVDEKELTDLQTKVSFI
jgi:hypothetical protein